MNIIWLSQKDECSYRSDRGLLVSLRTGGNRWCNEKSRINMFSSERMVIPFPSIYNGGIGSKRTEGDL